MSDSLDLGHHLGSSPGELPAHSGREVDHLDASAVETDLVQQPLYVFDPLSSVQITFQVMAFTRQSAGYEHPVGAVLERA